MENVKSNQNNNEVSEVGSEGGNGKSFAAKILIDAMLAESDLNVSDDSNRKEQTNGKR